MEEVVVKFASRVGDALGKASVRLYLMPEILSFY